MRIPLVMLVLLLSFFAESQVKKLNAETTIQGVAIFSSGARISRAATVSLPAGRTEIDFPELSNQLDQQTVQLKADADIVLLSVQTTRDYLTARKIEQEEKDLIEHSNVFKDKLDLDSRLLDVYKNEEAMLIKNQSVGGQAGLRAIDLKESLDFQRSRLTEIYAKELEIQKRVLQDQQDFEKTKLQLLEISRKKDSVRFIVTALIESKETRTVHFELSYNVKDAGWFPTYDVRVNDVTRPLNILMHANVFQRSGETWKNVNLILSTGSPKENATPSLLQPWLLGFYDPSISFNKQGAPGIISGRVTDDNNQPLSGASILVKGSHAATLSDANGFFRLQYSAGYGAILVSSTGFISKEISTSPGYLTIALEPSSTSLQDVVVVGYGNALVGAVAGVSSEMIDKKSKELITTASVTTRFQPTTTDYKIDDRYTLETDGKTTTIGIKQFEIPAIYDYYTAPKMDPSAFLTAKVINWQDYNLQSGEVSLYFEGSYLGKTYLDLGSVADTLSLSLGKDNGIRVSRKLVKEFSSKKFIGSSRTETKEFEITVRNTKTVPVNILVVDQIPVSTNKEINVDDVKVPEGQVDKDTGLINWTLILAPGQERKLSVGYSVKYPKDKKIVLE